MKSCLLCLVTILIVSGCGPAIGIYQIEPEECETSNNKILWEATKASDSNYISLIEKGIAPSKQDFLSKRGEPDETNNLSEAMEIWTYNEKIWCGYMPVFFVGAPIVMPVCDGYSRITFENGAAVKINYKTFYINRDLTTDRGDDRSFCQK